jgi:hypothetical protein
MIVTCSKVSDRDDEDNHDGQVHTTSFPSEAHLWRRYVGVNLCQEHMGAEFLRDAAMTAAVLGFFASAWFGWAQDDPPRSWRRPPIAGSVLSLGIALAGGLLAWRHWGEGTVFAADTSPAFGIVVGVEVALAGLGAALLALGYRG